ncbi:MAG: hypothetical protein R6W96_07735 [Clostridia bacterium]
MDTKDNVGRRNGKHETMASSLSNRERWKKRSLGIRDRYSGWTMFAFHYKKDIEYARDSDGAFIATAVLFLLLVLFIIWLRFN